MGVIIKNEKEYKIVRESVLWKHNDLDSTRQSRYVVYEKIKTKKTFGFQKEEEDWVVAKAITPNFDEVAAIFNQLDLAISFINGEFGKIIEEEIDVENEINT